MELAVSPTVADIRINELADLPDALAGFALRPA
jgi:hypothetical protein